MADKYFSIKTRNENSVNGILEKGKNIELDGLNVCQEQLHIGTPIFIVLGGDKPNWETGLVGIGVVSKEPYDVGYSKKNFKIQIDMKVLLDKPIKREDLVPYRDTYGINAIGPVIKGEPNQALTTMTENQALALMRAMVELCTDIKEDLVNLVDENERERIFATTRKFVEVEVKYGENSREALKRMIEGTSSRLSAKEQKERFINFLKLSKKSNGEDYNDGVIKNYVFYMEKGYSEFEQFKNYTSPFEIQCNDELGKYITYLFNEPEFEQFNIITTNRNCSSGFKKYVEFVKSTNKNKLCFLPLHESKAPYNRILFGAPGTGKSYELNKNRIELLGEDNSCDYERVTFHPDYTYANFVGTYKPVSKEINGEKSISYEYQPGPFMRVYVEALKNARTSNPRPFLLIIEEINRANVAAVFGDIFQLLDRDEYGQSEYPIHASEDMKEYLAEQLEVDKEQVAQLRIPNNMYIWATMNSADQGVFTMDTAFKRRWDFTYMGINSNEDKISGYDVELNNNTVVNWNSLRRAINYRLASLRVNEDKLLGPFFIKENIIKQNGKAFNDTFKNKVLMYLFEDAGRQKKSDIFSGTNQTNGGVYLYSEICDAFDYKGIEIFDKEISDKVEIKVNNSNKEEEN